MMAPSRWPFRRKPDLGFATVDQGHPLCPTLGFTFQNYINRGTLTVEMGVGALASRAYRINQTVSASLTPNRIVGPYGDAADFDSANQQLLHLRDPAGTAVAWSSVMRASVKSVLAGVTCRGAPVANASTFGLPAIFSDDGGYLALARGDRNSAGDGIYVYNYDGSDDFVKIPMTVGTPLACGYTHDGTTLIGFGNGTQAGTAASGATADLTGKIRLGVNFAGTYFDGVVHWIYFYNRVLSPDQMAWGMAEPWAFFSQPPRRTYKIPAAVAGGRIFTLVGDGGGLVGRARGLAG